MVANSELAKGEGPRAEGKVQKQSAMNAWYN